MMKEDWTPIDFGQTEDTTKNIIKVIGVGGGGCNAVKNMYAEGIVNVSFAVCNTDSQSLSKSPVPVKIMLGKSGLGAGANPEVGRSEAQNTLLAISSGVPNLPRAIREILSSILSPLASYNSAKRSVFTIPGATALTLIP